jgi:2-succinyl-5-enolpyruvyl-6-hydroxy-3-cyclohexene-1-carboxylate synthase
VTGILKSFLTTQGVKKVFFCSGSRNSSLLEELNSFDIEYLFDERSATFQALGVSQISDEPVVVCMTSGSALAESLPGVIEAFYSYKKLIIISADRPKRLHGTFAPQTINQSSIFSDFSRSSYFGKLSNFSLPKVNFPVHINLEIDDALEPVPDNKRIEIHEGELQKLYSSVSSAILVITDGHCLKPDEISYIENLSIPIYLECTANIELKCKTLKVDRTLLNHFKENHVDLVVKLGRTPISKIWRLLDNKYFNTQVLSINDKNIGLGRGNYIKTNRLQSVLAPLASISLPKLEDDLPFLESVIKLNQNSEIAIIKNIISNISPDSIVFCGNSMPIRYVQLLSRPIHFYVASRGANGIDGQVSTSIGIAKATTKEVHCIIGDLTFFYDIGAVIGELPKNLTIHVINNRGGRIFERVSAPEPIINEHDLKVGELFTDLSMNIVEYFPDNIETRNFWNDWGQS